MTYPPLHFALEAHGAAATLYLHGAMAADSAVRAFRDCYTLPSDIRRLRVDLREVHVAEPAVARTLTILLDHWHASRGSFAHVQWPQRHHWPGGERAA